MLIKGNERGPGLAGAADGFAHADGERADGFQALDPGCGERRAILPAHFGEKKFGVAENAGQRIIDNAKGDWLSCESKWASCQNGNR